MQNEFLEYVECRLTEWGKWSCQDEGMPPYVSNLENIRRNGGVFNKTVGARRLPENVNAEEIDRYVSSLKKIHPDQAHVLITYYKVKSDLKKYEVAEKLKISRKQFDILLGKGHVWVECELSRKLNS